MELRPPGTPVDDPFFAVVRRRHPEIDLVVLPPEAPAPEPTEVVDDETVARVRGLVGEFAAELSGAEATTRLRYGAHETTVIAQARVVQTSDDGHAALVEIRADLERRGWTVERLDGGIEQLIATLEGGHVLASYAEASGALLVTVTSSELPVGRERARELVGR